MLSIKLSLKTGVLLTIAFGFLYSILISSLDWTGWADSTLFHFQRERLLVYFMVFLLGALSYKLKVFEFNKSSRKYYILSNIVLTISLTVFTIVAINLFYNLITPGRNYFFISELADRSFFYLSFLLSMLSFLHIFIYSFQKWFNRSNQLMDHLNRNSYYVYIIHMIVLGLIALPLASVQLPAFLKYILLTVLTFGVSHFLIYLFRIILKKLNPIQKVALVNE